VTGRAVTQGADRGDGAPPRPRSRERGSGGEGPPLDAVVIGGGINGCAITRELALRGARVALFEQDDFGFGTTWRSTRLIHGGLRYLEHGDLRLVFESLRERAWLLRTRRHLVEPLRFLLPILPWTRRPAWQLAVGLTMYDVLALRREVPAHRRLSDARLHELAPGLAGETRGGFSYFDARAVAPERLALELALEARAAGATVLNHARVTRIHAAAGSVESVEVAQGETLVRVPARRVINAGGPWVDAVNAVTPDAPRPLLGVTRGSHILVELDRPAGRDAIFTTAKSDGRVLFVVPQGGNLLNIGTTDDRYDGDPGTVRATAEDVAYLLGEARTLLPRLGLREDQVRYAYTGLRPLQRVNGGPEAAISRRHAVIDHARDDGPAGLFSVIGGKLSTFRPLAEEVATGAGYSRVAPAPSLPPLDWRASLAQSGVPELTRRHLRKYGPAIPEILAAGSEIISATGAIRGEVFHAVRHELATTLSDILMRRTGIAWGPQRGLDCHHLVAAIAAELLNWDAAEQERQVRAFEADIAHHLPTVESLAHPGAHP
jgi:glycerol-3-phosphate dehydrogenase